jgi:hypothetical protein
VKIIWVNLVFSEKVNRIEPAENVPSGPLAMILSGDSMFSDVIAETKRSELILYPVDVVISTFPDKIEVSFAISTSPRSAKNTNRAPEDRSI